MRLLQARSSYQDTLYLYKTYLRAPWLVAARLAPGLLRVLCRWGLCCLAGHQAKQTVAWQCCKPLHLHPDVPQAFQARHLATAPTTENKRDMGV
jgi:hypothetical protein